MEEKELASGRGDFASPAAPATLCSHALAGEPLRIASLGLMCVVACQIAMTDVTFAAQHGQQDAVCPALLMDFECANYQQRLKLAVNAEQHEQVVAEYALIQSERRRVCPVSDKAAQRAAQMRSAQRR
jgi:hypothetical protein